MNKILQKVQLYFISECEELYNIKHKRKYPYETEQGIGKEESGKIIQIFTRNFQKLQM